MSVLNGRAEALVSELGFTSPIASRYSVRSLQLSNPSHVCSEISGLGLYLR